MESEETPRTLIRGVLAHLPVSDSAVKPAARERRSSAGDALRPLPVSTSMAKKRRISTATPRTLIRGVLETQVTPEITTEEPARKVARVTPQVRGQPTPNQAGRGATFASPSGSAPRSVRQGVRRSARISPGGLNSAGSAYFTRRQGRVNTLLTPQDDTPRTMLRNILHVLPIETPAVHTQTEVSLLEENTSTLEEPVREEVQVQQSAQPTPEMDLPLPQPRRDRAARATRTAHVTVEQFAAGVEERLGRQASQTEANQTQGEEAETLEVPERGDAPHPIDALVNVEDTGTPAVSDSRHHTDGTEDNVEGLHPHSDSRHHTDGTEDNPEVDHIGTDSRHHTEETGYFTEGPPTRGAEDSAEELESAQDTDSQGTTSQAHQGGVSSWDGDDEMSSQPERNAGTVAPDFIYTQDTQPDVQASSPSQREPGSEEFVPETQMSPVQQDNPPSPQDNEQVDEHSVVADSVSEEVLSDNDMFEGLATGVRDEEQDEEDSEVEDDKMEGEENEREDGDMSEEENDIPADGGEAVGLHGTEVGQITKSPARQQVRPVRPRRRRAPSDNSLPHAYTKSIFSHFCQRPVSRDAMEEVEKGCEKFFANITKDLMKYAVHGNRQTIQTADVELLMRRQGFVTDKQSLNSLIEKYLPLEHREELIPMATSGNKITVKSAEKGFKYKMQQW